MHVGAADRPEGLVLTARKVWLGKTTLVARALPDRDIRMIGAWCFLDHYGPEDVSEAPGMQVYAHPHTGLQTVSWLIEGEIEHRDSLGTQAMVSPGTLNIMTAGRGIVHSEISQPDKPPTLHGVQLWVALPDAVRDTAPRFDRYTDLPRLPTGTASVVRCWSGRSTAYVRRRSASLRWSAPTSAWTRAPRSSWRWPPTTSTACSSSPAG